jgi:nucleotide-binding universal stress UspA family protein
VSRAAESDAPMFKHILVPIDLSGRNEGTLAATLQLAQQSRARVVLLHVIQRIEHVPLPEIRAFYEKLERAARKKMVAVARKLAARGVDVRATVLVGTPAREIVRYAAANGVDLIVLGSHKLDLSRPSRGWGTTSYKVGVLCQCPVRLVK